MKDNLLTANALLLDPADLNVQQIENVLSKVLGNTIDEADIYIQSRREENWHLEDSIVKEGDFSIDRGFGLRVGSGEKTGFAYADHLDLKSLSHAAQSAKRIVYSGGEDERKIQTSLQP